MHNLIGTASFNTLFIMNVVDKLLSSVDVRYMEVRDNALSLSTWKFTPPGKHGRKDQMMWLEMV